MPRDYNHLYNIWRRAVYRRDKANCQMPRCTHKAYNAHHIVRWADDFSKRFDVDNGISLCYNHHHEVTGKENHYVKLFMEIVHGKK